MINILLICASCVSNYVLAMEMESSMGSGHSHGTLSPEEQAFLKTRPNIQDAYSRTFHWIATLLCLFLLPSLATGFAFASRYRGALYLHFITGIYCILEVFVLNFNDNDGVENRTSKGTGIFMLIIIWLTVGICLLQRVSKLRNYSILLERTIQTLSLVIPLTGFIKVCLAPIAMFGFCKPGHTGQCAAHGIMGSSFIFYGFVYCLVLVIPRIRLADYSQDHIDSWVMCLYGIVNTFTEHRWGREEWFMHDYQHTAMGILWWCGGILGIFLSRKGKRTFIPGLIIMFTGWAMTQHAQQLAVSTNVHYLFGLILTIGGALRIIEISFLLNDRMQSNNNEILSFQYLPPFCLICSGTLFMSANEEQLKLVIRLGSEHSAYIMVVVSGAFLLTFWILFSLEFYLYLSEHKETSLLQKYSLADNQSASPSEEDYELDNTEV